MKPRHPIEMKIILDTNGNLQVSCTQLNDQLFCLGLLEQAKLAIISHNIRLKMKEQAERTDKKIVTPEDIIKRGKI